MISDDIYNLSEDELIIVKRKKSDENQLGFALLLKYIQLEGHYPRDIKYIDPLMVVCIANQINVYPTCIDSFDWEGRSTERYRNEIRALLGFKKASAESIDQLRQWLQKEVFPNAPKKSQYLDYAYEFFRAQHTEPPISNEIIRHCKSAHAEFEDKLFSSITAQLPNSTKNLVNKILSGEDDDDTSDETDDENQLSIRFNQIKRDIPGAKLKNVNYAKRKLDVLSELVLPTAILSDLSVKLLKKYYTRVMAEPPSSMRSRTPGIRYAMFSLFAYYRTQLLLDSLSDLLLQLIHKIKTSATNFIDKKILLEIKRVNGKFDILYQLASLSSRYPQGVIEETIYPEVSEDVLKNLVDELSHKGKWYENQVQVKMRSLYSHSHRRVLLSLLTVFEFRTNLNECQATLDAVQYVLQHRDSSDKFYNNIDDVPTQDVISTDWQDMVFDTDKSGSPKVNRFNYEIAVLEKLRTLLRCKMVWIEGAYRYRNPDHDLPKDFNENREYYYKKLGLPLDPQKFIEPKKAELHDSLRSLNDTITENDKVTIADKNGGHIKISPYDPQPEPPNIKNLHRAIKNEFGTINLIDILKETDLQVGFTEQFDTVASKEAIPKNILQYRLLLCLYAIGTNTGLKPISSANNDVSDSDLRYVKRRFITVDNVRQALVIIINATLSIRDPRIWGEATTSVACDSKKISVWDQNLLVEWHTRYKGRGVMIYWHVESKALCIYSQLKTCSSSEVGSMIKGILHHCTDMAINAAYVDTHGQSTLAFGVSEFLFFDLLPRLKNIHKQKLYYPSPTHKKEYSNLKPILKDAINWNLIVDNYDEAVKHIAALKFGMMEPEVFVKRFSKDNYQHPVYRAIIETGKASKTTFLCRYLMIEALRIEVHEAQNVVERLNSIMGFIFFGKLGEISTNVKIDQELAIVCLHLLQACMSYVNTLIFQTILSRPEWQDLLTPEDKRALNLLFHQHINPYGLFPLDLTKRLEKILSTLQTDSLVELIDLERVQSELE